MPQRQFQPNSGFLISLSFLAISCKTVADYFLEIPEQYLRVIDRDRISMQQRQQLLEAAKKGHRYEERRAPLPAVTTVGNSIFEVTKEAGEQGAGSKGERYA